MTPKPILGYWDVRGYAQPIRLLLTYLQVDFEDKLYPLSVENEGASWFKNEKFKLGLDFPNLPYYFDGEVKLTQTLAILRYLGRKYNVDGSTEAEKVAISLVEQQVDDYMIDFSRVAYDLNCEKLKEEYLKYLPASLKQVSDYLGERAFVAGTNISYVDFWLYEYLLKISVVLPEIFNKYGNLKKYIERIESLPRVSTYIKTAKPALFIGPRAKWNAAH